MTSAPDRKIIKSLIQLRCSKNKLTSLGRLDIVSVKVTGLKKSIMFLFMITSETFVILYIIRVIDAHK
jgi:hypothetical protein